MAGDDHVGPYLDIDGDEFDEQADLDALIQECIEELENDPEPPRKSTPGIGQDQNTIWVRNGTLPYWVDAQTFCGAFIEAGLHSRQRFKS